MNHLSEQTVKYLCVIRTLNPNLYKKMCKKIGVSDDEILQNKIDVPEMKKEVYCSRPNEIVINPNKETDSKFSNVYYMGGKPYIGFRREPQKREEVFSIDVKKAKDSHSNKDIAEKKTKKVYLYIDAENVASKYCKQIMQKSASVGKLKKKRCYRRGEDASTTSWTDEAREHEIKMVPISGEPKKDKIDNIIKEDIRNAIKRRVAVEVICIVTSDGGYIDIVKEIKRSGKQAVIIGEEKTPEKLREEANKFIKLEKL